MQKRTPGAQIELMSGKMQMRLREEGLLLYGAVWTADVIFDIFSHNNSADKEQPKIIARFEVEDCHIHVSSKSLDIDT